VDNYLKGRIGSVFLLMKKLLYPLYAVGILLILTSCGRIRNDDFNVYSTKTDFGNFTIKLQPHRSGLIFIHYGPPYDLFMSFNFKHQVRSAKILSLSLDKIGEPNSLLSFNNIKLSVVPNPGESNVYHRLSGVLTEYKDVRLHIHLEIISKDGSQASYTYIKNFKKHPSTRWWSFFELV
jgi:hypothetical protein